MSEETKNIFGIRWDLNRIIFKKTKYSQCFIDNLKCERQRMVFVPNAFHHSLLYAEDFVN